MPRRRTDRDPFGLIPADWERLARAKDEYWRAFKRRHGSAAGIRIGDELWRQAKAVRPDWPTSAERRDDLACHLRVIDELARASACSR